MTNQRRDQMNPEDTMAPNFLSELVGSFAIPAAENPTVAIMEAAFKHHGLDWRYLNCEVTSKDLAAAVGGAKAMGWAGFNCSIPHKIAVIEHIDHVGKSAEIIGAVNTVIIRNGQMTGENTDGRGFVESISAKINLSGKEAVIFGAGGAARAVAVELALAGVETITIANRTRQRGESLVDLINGKTNAKAKYAPWPDKFSLPSSADIVVNATSIGLFPDVDGELAIDWSTLTPNMLVADGIHNPPETHLIRTAKSIGCEALDGLAMLVNVCAICIKLWTDVDVDKQVMRAAVASLNTPPVLK
jgi:shikimate dehydrogenase